MNGNWINYYRVFLVLASRVKTSSPRFFLPSSPTTSFFSRSSASSPMVRTTDLRCRWRGRFSRGHASSRRSQAMLSCIRLDFLRRLRLRLPVLELAELLLLSELLLSSSLGCSGSGSPFFAVFFFLLLSSPLSACLSASSSEMVTSRFLSGFLFLAGGLFRFWLSSLGSLLPDESSELVSELLEEDG